MQACVDIIRSALQHYMRAISKFIRVNKEIRVELTNVPWIPLLTGNTEDLVDFICCEKVSHPHLVCGIGKSRRVPRFIKWECAHGTCEECGVEKLDINNYSILTENTSQISVLEWKNVPRQGTTKNGKQRTQLELSRAILPVCIIVAKFIEQLEICRLHQVEYKWINYARVLDFIMSPPTSLVLATDFGATLNLCAAEKDNCSVDNHAVVAIFFVLRDW